MTDVSLRTDRPLGLSRYENSAEHSWQLAILAVSLAHLCSALNRYQPLRLLLVHDIGEIDVGDTIVYSEGDGEERKARELTAVKRICGMLPQDRAAAFITLWQEFDRGILRGPARQDELDRIGGRPMGLTLGTNHLNPVRG